MTLEEKIPVRLCELYEAKRKLEKRDYNFSLKEKTRNEMLTIVKAKIDELTGLCIEFKLKAITEDTFLEKRLDILAEIDKAKASN